MTRSKSPRIPGIDELRSRFEQWRQTRQGRARIPDRLWAAAAALARRDGVNKTAAALRLDGGKLKRRMAAPDARSGKAAPPAFVEFVASGADGAPEYTIEFEGHHGKLRIHSKGATAADLAELSRALWGLAG
jgi:2-hydroxychromene-2-carboxylate isomerase